MAETELERAEKRYAQAKARLQALRNRAATQERKMDTRRKVILGGAGCHGGGDARPARQEPASGAGSQGLRGVDARGRAPGGRRG